jgi:hypothetical protein
LSGGIFSCYLTLHLTNFAAAGLGPLGYDEAMKFFRLELRFQFFDVLLNFYRKFYQHPIIEPIVIGSLVVHTVTGFYFAYERYKRESALSNDVHKKSVILKGIT